MLFIISTAIIGVSSAAIVSLQNANAVNNDGGGTNSSCKQRYPSDTSKKCSKKDTPFILPFP
jgi:hypothetical protein